MSLPAAPEDAADDAEGVLAVAPGVEFDGRVGCVGAFEDDLAGEDVDALEIDGLIEPDGIEASGGDVALALDR